MSWRPLADECQPPTELGTALEAVLRRLGGGSVKSQKSIFDAWHEAVGPEISSHAFPIALVDGVLSVEVDDVRWLTQLKWLGGRVADRLNEASGNDLVERLNVRLTSSKTIKTRP